MDIGLHCSDEVLDVHSG